VRAAITAAPGDARYAAAGGTLPVTEPVIGRQQLAGRQPAAQETPPDICPLPDTATPVLSQTSASWLKGLGGGQSQSVAWQRNGRSSHLLSRGRGFEPQAERDSLQVVRIHVPLSVTKQFVLVKGMMPCSWEANRRSGVALVMPHKLQ